MILASVHGAHLEKLLLLALIATSALGAVGGYLSHVGIPRAVGTAIVGGLAVPVAVLTIILLSTYLGSTCLGEELG